MGSSSEIFFCWKHESGTVGTGLENSFWQPSVYWIPRGIMWKINWVLALHSEKPECGHMGTGSSLMSACDWSPEYLLVLGTAYIWITEH